MATPISREKVYVGDVGTEIRVDCKVNILSAIEAQMRVLKPNGGEASWHADILGVVGSFVIENAGLGYSVGDSLLVSQNGASDLLIYVDTVDVVGAVLTAHIEVNGVVYEPAMGLPTSGGTGTGCIINILSLASATILRYFILPGDLNESGIYTIQANVRLPNWSGLGESTYLEVYDKYH